MVFKKAWELKYGHVDLNIISCGGTDNMAALAKPGNVLSSISKSDYVFALVDNDAAGRDIYKNKRLKPEGGNWVKDSRNEVYWCRLYAHDEFKSAMGRLNIPEKAWPLTLENSYSIETIKKAIEDGAYSLTEEPCTEIYDQQNKLISRFITAKTNDDICLPYLSSADKDKKIDFAEWISEKAELEPNILVNIYNVLDSLFQIISSNSSETKESQISESKI